MSPTPPSEIYEIALGDLIDMLERQVGDILHAEALENRRCDELRQLVVTTATASEELIRRKTPSLLPRLEHLLQNLGRRDDAVDA